MATFQIGYKKEDFLAHLTAPTLGIAVDWTYAMEDLTQTYVAVNDNEFVTSVSCHYSSTFAVGDIKYALYEHDGVVPQALVAETAEITALTNANPNRATQTVEVMWPLEKGKRYCLGIISDSPSQYWAAVDNLSGTYLRDTTSSWPTFPDPAAGAQNVGRYALWADGETIVPGNAVPGEPADGTPYDPGLPDAPQGSDPYTASDDDNFDPTTLEAGQEIGAPEQLLICDRSGFKIDIKQGLKKTWDNFMVRKESWEPRQPLDFVRTKPERGQKGSPRPEQEDVFLDTNDVSADDL